MQICLLASGSKGNAVFIRSRESRILIDAGLSAKEMGGRLRQIGEDGEGLHGLLLTHEHSDHSRGAGPVARRFDLPLLVHAKTRGALPALGKIKETREFDTGDVLHLRDMRVETFHTTHDAAAPVGFTIETAEGKIGIATDLGIATRLVRERLKGCRALILETNHDEEMLRDGPYPWPLKQRIRGTHGHLSNTAAAELLGELLWDGLEAVFLAHLSEVNNTPALAEGCILGVLENQNLCRPQVVLGCQARPSACVSL